MTSRLGLRRGLTALIVSAALVFLVARLVRQWDEVAALDLHPRWAPILLATLTLGLWFSLRAILWMRLVESPEARLPVRRAAALWFVSELGRYVPGAGWHFVARAALSARLGVRPAAALVASLLELGMTTLAAATLALLFLPEAGRAWVWPLRVAGLLLIAVVLAVQGPLLSRAVSILLRMLRRPPLPISLGMTRGLAVFPLALGAWLAHGGAFLLFARGLGLAPSEAWPMMIGAYAAAWLAGVLVVVAPGGLGVRENVLASLLLPALAESEALVLALAARVWVTVAEVLFTLLALALAASRRR